MKITAASEATDESLALKSVFAPSVSKMQRDKKVLAVAKGAPSVRHRPTTTAHFCPFSARLGRRGVSLLDLPPTSVQNTENIYQCHSQTGCSTELALIHWAAKRLFYSSRTAILGAYPKNLNQSPFVNRLV